MAERPIQKFLQEIRSNPDIKYISDKSAQTIHAVSCPVLDTLPDGIVLGGHPAFPKKRWRNARMDDHAVLRQAMQDVCDTYHIFRILRIFVPT